MEFNFNSYHNSKQSISYCEVDKCKAVIKLKKCLQEIKEIATENSLAQVGYNPDWDIIIQKISKCEGNNE